MIKNPHKEIKPCGTTIRIPLGLSSLRRYTGCRGGDKQAEIIIEALPGEYTRAKGTNMLNLVFMLTLDCYWKSILRNIFFAM